MTTDELDRSLRQPGGAGGIAEMRFQSDPDKLGPTASGRSISSTCLVHDELQRRRDRLIERRIKAAGFRDQRTLDSFDWKFNTLEPER